MATLFTRIITGELTGRFVWQDEHCVAIMTIAPIRPGHTLVIPRQEVEHWPDLAPDLAAHLMTTAQVVARAIQAAFPCRRVGLMVAGLEVPHVHLHLTPLDVIADMDFARQDMKARPEDLDAAAERIRVALRAMGYAVEAGS
jgi:histidine triad (HIT) family protein